MKRIQLWSVIDTDEGAVRAVGVDELAGTETEERLEELLVASPELLLDGLSLIGRQLPSDAGVLDLLGIDQDGRLVLLELKRGTLTREAVAQILDYVSELTSRDPEQLARLIEEHSGHKGIEKLDDFADWYSREFPTAAGPLEQTPRMLLVGLGVDDRARRIVNFLAESGIDIHLLTFHAFRSGGGLFLARQVETVAPSQSKPTATSATKEDNQRALLEWAERQGVRELLTIVADFIQGLGPFYRWPGKTAFSFSLQERTKEGRPTNLSYVTLWVQSKRRGKLLVSLAPRAIEAAPDAVSSFVDAVASASRVDSSWIPIQVDIDDRTWVSVQEPLERLLRSVVAGWQRRTANEEEDPTETVSSVEVPKSGDTRDVDS